MEAVAAAEDRPTPVPEPESAGPRTAWHLFDGQHVIVQLFEPYIAGAGPQGLQTVPVLEGELRVLPGSASTLLLVLRIEGGGSKVMVSMHPSDVKHVSLMEKSSIVRP